MICTFLFGVLTGWLLYVAIKALSRVVDELLTHLRIYFDARNELEAKFKERVEA